MSLQEIVMPFVEMELFNFMRNVMMVMKYPMIHAINVNINVQNFAKFANLAYVQDVKVDLLLMTKIIVILNVAMVF